MRTYHEIEATEKGHVFKGAERVESISRLTGWENIASLEFSLAYHYNRVYITVYHIYNGTIGTVIQKPITKAMGFELSVAEQLFCADKFAGFISENYQFN